MLRISSTLAATTLSKRLIIACLIATITISSITGSLISDRQHKNVAAADSCGDVFDPLPSWLTTRLNENKSVYQQVAGETGVPWPVLAAVHYREYNLAVANPGNGQGIYQLYSSGEYFTPGSVSKNEFIRQTRLAANFIQGKAQVVPSTSTIKARKLTSNDTDINLIKSTLFSYNGRASAYAQQAATYGYDSINQAYEGSPYVANKFDCKRKAMGLITSDGSNSLTGTDTRMGAFTLYARIKSEAYWNSLQVGNLPGCKQATGTTTSCVWRLYNPGYKNYVYTTSFDKRNNYVARGYTYDGVGFFGRNPISTKLPNQVRVYQLENGNGGSMLTANADEYSALKNAGWLDQGTAFYADPVGSNTGYAVYRLFNSSIGAHIWTKSLSNKKSLESAGYVSEGVAFHAISEVRQENPAPEGQYNVYRFSNMPENRHFWTKDVTERDSMITRGYKYEGIAWRASAPNTSKPVYRLYSPTMKKHLYTTDAYERDVLNKTSSWRYEGVAWYSNPSSTGGVPVYRLYSSFNTAHFFTTSSYERDVLRRSGAFRYEGIAWQQP